MVRKQHFTRVEDPICAPFGRAKCARVRAYLINVRWLEGALFPTTLVLRVAANDRTIPALPLAWFATANGIAAATVVVEALVAVVLALVLFEGTGRNQTRHQRSIRGTLIILVLTRQTERAGLEAALVLRVPPNIGSICERGW